MNAPERPPVRHVQSAARFEARVDGLTALAEYRREGDVLVMTHTEVPAPLEGRGIAGALVQAAVDHARAQRLRIRPVCSYVVAWMQRHPEAADVLDR